MWLVLKHTLKKHVTHLSSFGPRWVRNSSWIPSGSRAFPGLSKRKAALISSVEKYKLKSSCSCNSSHIFMYETSRFAFRVKVLSRSLKMPFATTCFAIAFGERGYFALIEFRPVSLLILCQAFREEWVKSMSETNSFHLARRLSFSLFTRFVAEMEIYSWSTDPSYRL